MVQRKRLLYAGFMAILAAGVGLSIRSAIFPLWDKDFSFNDFQKGEIGGGGLTGFCFGIIIGGVIADKIGYGKLVVAAFLLHMVSAFLTFFPSKGMSAENAMFYLKWGSFIFAVANGTLEAVANPLVATLFPENRTHYLNLLHASWPLGLALGSFAALGLGPDGANLSWKLQLGLFLVPTAIYGIMFLGQSFPKSEASQKGMSLGDMFKDVGILGGVVICLLLSMFFIDQFNLPPTYSYAIGGAILLVIALITRFSIGAILLFVLFIAHGLIGSVELGTDTWIQNINGKILTPSQGQILFVYVSLIMFGLRFCAHFIEKNLKLSPIGILFVCSILACLGLNLAAGMNTFPIAMVALGVYAVGKTFFWPTMLAVASDRFPRTGAVAISIMGGIGMMSAGLIGSPGLGFFKDKYAAESFEKTDAATYVKYKKDKENNFVFMKGAAIDREKFNALDKKIEDKKAELQKAGDTKTDPMSVLSAEEKKAIEIDKAAAIEGSRGTLRVDSFLPAAMAVIYLLLLLYFKAIGGYKAVHINAPDTDAEQ
ncbi:MAG TPA: MFS transporter [Planctomycetota bacterium]|nr:MFS transporter [Planctomycetota bacterium]